MRKKLALTGFILATCISAIAVLAMIMSAIFVIDVVAGSAGSGLIIAVIVLEVLFFIGSLVLNAVAIPTTSSASKFKKRKGLVITAIVFNFIAVFMYILSMTTGIDSSTFMSIIFMLALIAANVLIIVDLARNGKALEQEEYQNGEMFTHTPEAKEISTQTSVAQNNDSTDALEEEINKLLLLKAKNLITDEEFAELKKHAIEKRMK